MLAVSILPQKTAALLELFHLYKYVGMFWALTRIFQNP